ncbi:MAG: class I SAM-dependent methyltransferase [Geobacteraceae bacterium]|nr:class I SAM-dependent methyltransferase [Geobacteraceae bacterium]
MEYEATALRAVTGTTIRPGGLSLTDRAIEFCPFADGAELLDVGCGVGASVEHLRSRYGFDAKGIDISPKLIAEGLLTNPALPIFEGMAEALPCPDDSQDGILCECVLSLLTEPLQALAEFRRALRSGGYLMMSDMYNRDSLTRQIETWLFENGFTLLLWEDHSCLLRELAARLILANGSLEGLCCTATGTPGYFLLVARKE